MMHDSTGFHTLAIAPANRSKLSDGLGDVASSADDGDALIEAVIEHLEQIENFTIGTGLGNSELIRGRATAAMRLLYLARRECQSVATTCRSLQNTLG